jgi:hypothetical protein
VGNEDNDRRNDPRLNSVWKRNEDYDFDSSELLVGEGLVSDIRLTEDRCQELVNLLLPEPEWPERMVSHVDKSQDHAELESSNTLITGSEKNSAAGSQPRHVLPSGRMSPYEALTGTQKRLKLSEHSGGEKPRSESELLIMALLQRPWFWRVWVRRTGSMLI